MKAEVYSWRLSTELKSSLEDEAKRRRVSVSAILDVAAREWLVNSRAEVNSGDEQLRLHNSASKYLGRIAGRDPHRSENVTQIMRQRLRKRRGR